MGTACFIPAIWSQTIVERVAPASECRFYQRDDG